MLILTQQQSESGGNGSSIDSDLDDEDSAEEMNSISHLVLCQYERVIKSADPSPSPFNSFAAGQARQK